MTQRVTWLVAAGDITNAYHIREAVASFYMQFNMKPNVVKLSLTDYNMMLNRNISAESVIFLEVDKKYANFIATACGPILVEIMDPQIESVMSSHGTPSTSTYSTQSTVFFVENNEIDEAFEKHLLESKS